MPQSATIKSLPHAFRMMEEMQVQDIEWGEDYRHAARAALKDVLEGRMAAGVDRHLEDMAARDEADRRNGGYRRWLMTELGEIELSVPRTRTYSALEVVRAYARRAGHVDRMILACFGCCQSNANQSRNRARTGVSGRKLTPLRHSGRSILLEDIAAV